MALKNGDPAPDFTLPADDGTPVHLADLRGKKVILFFYPRADTPGCTVEACEFRDNFPDIQEQGAVVLGLSPDTVPEVKRFREKFSLPYPLLADENHAVAELYGVWKLKEKFGREYWGVDRTTFLVDESGNIAKIFEKVTPKGHAGEVIESLAGK